ncbi:helix-turn-helix domain-containing protein [Neisseria dumasiana]|uniref:Phage repressor protein n=1 Tax=Neisseria dumasiana TaxID=1931275 RepID=A0A1X3DI60_9NEIS|nr:LexA family transcriptional regulator [Neisseria dumasiana]OSI21673.1 phage repressor protein [Neisseria dumasiana]
MEIGKNIRTRRKKLKMTLEQLALEIGSDTGNLSRIERGQQSLTTDKIAVIAKALNCLPVDLLAEDKSQIQLPPGYIRVPVLDSDQIKNWRKLRNHISHVDISEWLVTDAEISSESFSFEIKDLSMFPDFKIGDRIILDPTLVADAGDFVLAISAMESLIFRKYRARGIDKNGIVLFELFPINEDYEIFYSNSGAIQILGVMVEHRKYHRR